MTAQYGQKLRAILLAGVLVVAVAGGGVAFVGGTAANEHHDLQASDGAGGDASFVFADTDDQVPRGVQSKNDTLEVRAEGEPLPNGFFGELRLEGDEVTFDTSQSPADVELVVFGDQGSEERESVAIDSIESDVVEFQALFEQSNGDPIFGDPDEEPIGVRFTNLSFDAGSPEEATLVWDVPEDQGQAEHTLEVREFAPDVTATDEEGSDMAHLTDGAAEQRMTGVNDADTLVLRGDEIEFPSSFDVTLELDEGGVTFTEGQPVDVVTSSGAATASVSEDGTQIHVAVEDFDGNEDDVAIVQLQGVTFDAEPGSSVEDITWTVGESTTTYTLEPVRLDAGFDQEYELTRGLDGQPDGGATLQITSDWRVGSTDAAFTTAGETVTVSAPAAGLEFDTRQVPDGEVRSEDQTISLLGVPLENVRYEQEDGETVLRFEVPVDIEDDEEIIVEGIHFNTTAVDETVDDESAAFDAGLDVEYVPENALGSVTIHSDEDLHVRVPDVTVEGAPTSLDLQQTSTGGDSPLSVVLTDTSGNQMEAGSSIVIGLHDTNISFDPAQEDDLTAETDNPFFAVSVDSVSEDEIVLEVGSFTDSSEGDEITLRHADGEGIRFDTSGIEEPDAARLTVRTNAGDAAITQLTDPVAVVYPDVVDLAVQEPDTLTAKLDNQPVVLSVVDGDGEALTGIDVSAAGDPITDTFNKSVDGRVTFSLSPTETGTVTFDAINAEPVTLDVEQASIEANPTQIDVGEVTDVTVTVTDAEGAGIEGVEVEAAGGPLENGTNATTDADGTAVLALQPTSEGDVEISAEELGISTTVEAAVDEPSSPPGGGGGSGGGGSGGAPPGTSPFREASLDIVSTAISATAVDVGDTVDVDVTVENSGDADGEHTVELSVNGVPVAEETIEVAAETSETLTFTLSFGSRGIYDVSVDDVAVETVYVGLDPSDVVDAETVSLQDGTSGQDGLRVDLSRTSVRAVTFSNADAVGQVTVADLARVPPGIGQPEGTVLKAVEIQVPDAEIDNPATVEIAVDADAVSDADATADELTVVRYDESAGAWESLDTEVLSEGDEVLLSAETPGFSTFAVTAQEDEQPTDPVTDTPPADDDDYDSAGLFGPMTLVGLGIIGLIALLLAFAGARVYRETGREEEPPGGPRL